MPKVKGEINLFLDLSHKKYGKNEKCTGNSRGDKEKFMGNNVNPARKILLIATGGTIACRETGHGLTPVLDGEGLLRELPGLSEVCRVEVLDLMQRDSTDITADDRMQMARAVWEKRGAYDGFVIAHGTDTLACTAALLHHLLPHIDRPVVVTGSMLPMGAEGSDRREICSMHCAWRRMDGAACMPCCAAASCAARTSSRCIRPRSMRSFRPMSRRQAVSRTEA